LAIRCAPFVMVMLNLQVTCLYTDITAKIWYDIVKWIGYQMMLPPTLNHSFAMMASCGKGKRGKKGMMLIWHSFIWTVWRMRNNRIFNNGVIDAEEAVESIKRLSWQWCIGRLARRPCLFYEWRWDPGDCFSRWRCYCYCGSGPVLLLLCSLCVLCFPLAVIFSQFVLLGC
jgi:hypothetical protein